MATKTAKHTDSRALMKTPPFATGFIYNSQIKRETNLDESGIKMTEIIRKHTNQRMSKIVIHGDTIYLCGQVGIRGTSITEQTKEALSRVETLLTEAGSSKRHILQTTVWLSDMKYFQEMNVVWDNWVEEGYAPARACGEARLASDDLFVELLVTAAKA